MTTINAREALVTLLLLALLLCVAFFNIVFLGESLITGNNENPLFPPFGEEGYGPGNHPLGFFQARGVYAYANLHDPGAAWFQGEAANEFLERALAQGEFPLWDPYVGGGAPAMANLTPAFFYPPSFLVSAFGNEPWMKDAYALLNLLAAGFFTYVFLRKHGVSALGSRAAGIAFMFSGAMVQTASQFIGQTVAGMPIVLAATACLMHRPTWRRTAVTALVYAFVALASFPPILFFAFSLAVLYVAAIARRAELWTRFACAALLSLALVAFYFIPTAHVILEADHVRAAYRDVGMETLDRRSLFKLLGPTLVEGTTVYHYPVVHPTHGNLCYAGVTVLLLAAATFGRLRPRPLMLLMQIMAAIVLLKLFGIQPVQLIGKLPVLNSMHLAYYGGFLLAFLLACLTGLAIDLVLERRVLLAPAIGASLVLAYAFFRLRRIALSEGLFNPQFWRWEADYRIAIAFLAIAAVMLLIRKSGAVRFAAIALVTLVAAEGVMNASFRRMKRWNYWDHPPRYVQAMTARRTLGRALPFGAFSANANAPYAIGSTDSLLAFNSGRYANVHHRYLQSPAEVLLRRATVIPADPILDALAVDRLVIPAGRRNLVAGAAARGYPVLYVDDWAVVYERPSAPRYFLTRDYSVVTGERALAELERRRPGQLLLERRPGFASDSSSVRGDVVVERFGLNSYRLRVNSSHPALLSLSETQFPGWTARVRGKPVPILAANYAFRAIEVPAGESIVELSYWPPGMTAGLAISAIALLIAIGMIARSRSA